MTDPELEGLAAQAFNMARRDIERRESFGLFFASYFQGEGLRRMKSVADVIVEKLGEDWLNNGAKKDAAFGMLRLAIDTMPPDAVVLGSVVNWFRSTPKLMTLSIEKQKAIVDGGHDKQWKAVREGYLVVSDALSMVAQTPVRVCTYTRGLPFQEDEKPVVHFFDQADFGGRLKMFGKESAHGGE